MKRLNYVLVILLCFFIQDAYSQSHWTFYKDSNYKGSQKKYDSGEMKTSYQWKWNSWKSDCCIKFYYYSKHGAVREKKLCGDIKDLKAELKKWDDLKYGYHQGWKNIYKIRLYCDDGKYANNRNNHDNRNNYNNRNNHDSRNNHDNRNNNNRNNHNNYDNKQEHPSKQDHNVKGDYTSMDWYKYYGKGNVIFAEDYNYGGKYKARATGSQDYRSLQFYPRSILLSKSGRYIVMEYRDHQNRRKSVVLKKDVPDLKKYMSNLKIASKYNSEPYKATTKFTIMRY